MATDPPPSSQPKPEATRLLKAGAPSPPAAAPAGGSAHGGEDAGAVNLKHQITLRYDSQEWPGLIATTSVLEQSQLQARYRIGGEIGRGGMGAIVKVVDGMLNRPVAMKVMLGVSDEFHRQRFVEEAQITGQLEHPGIVPVHDIGNDRAGNLFFTMKLVNGTSLAEVLRRLAAGDQAAQGEFPLTRLLRILVDVSHAVAFAHHRGVIHRDLKPANIMIGRFGEVQVMDWGLAKVISGALAPSAPAPRPAADADAAMTAAAAPAPAPASVPGQAATAAEQPITSTRDAAMNTLYGTIVGTPSYMSPEQASGDPAKLTYRSDVYALGALLYEILTLTPPVRGNDAFAILARVVNGRIERPERRAPARAIPGELSAIAMKALQGDPLLRYPSVGEFRADLELFLDGRAVSAKADAPWETIGKLVRRNRAASTAIAVAASLIVLVIAGAFAMTVSDRQQAVHSERLALDAKAEALEALVELRKEQAEKEREHARRGEAERRALPGFLLQARAAIDLDHDEEATRTIDLVLTIDAQNSEALLLRGQLALVLHAWPAAAAALWDYLRLMPGDRDAQQLLELARSPVSAAGSPARDAAIAAILARQGAIHLASRSAGALTQKFEILRRHLDQLWPGAGDHLSLTPDQELCFDARPFKAAITDLSPLHGAPLTRLDLSECHKIVDLGSLRGMPLNWLTIDQCILVSDLSPLAGMRLHYLNLRNCNRIKDFSVLKGMPIDWLDLSECGLFKDLTLIAGMPLLELSLRSCALIGDYSPLAKLPLTRLNVGNSPFSDIALLARIPSLRILYCGQSGVKDITPCASMPLTELELPHDIHLVGLELLRHHPTLTSINFMPPADFWKRLDHDHAVP